MLQGVAQAAMTSRVNLGSFICLKSAVLAIGTEA